MVAGLPNKRSLPFWRGTAPAVLAMLFLSCASLLTSASGNHLNLSNTPGDSLFPSLAASGEHLFLAWDDDSVGEGAEIFFVRSGDGGRSFGAALNLSNNAGISRNPALAAFNDNVYAVWEDDTTGNSEIFLSVSRDGGLSFAEPVNLSQNAGGSLLPALAVSSQAVYIAWQDGTPGNDEVVLTRSFDHGRTFSTARNISRTPGASWSPAIAADGSNLYLAWEEESAGARQILLAQSSDGAETFGGAVNLSGQAEFATAAALGAYNGSLFVTWTQEFGAGNYDVMLAQSADRGQTFTTPANVSGSQAYSGASVIAASAAGVQLAWVEAVEIGANGGSQVDFEIFAKQIDGSASSSSGTDVKPENLSATSATSVNPAVLALPDGLYAAWADYSSGNFEILFTRQ